MAHLVPIPFAVVTVTMLVRSRFRGDQRQEYLLKPISTVLVIAVALLSLLTPSSRPVFTLWVTLGLVLSLGGDVALMFRRERWFLIGLVLFLLAHVVYSVGFTVFNGFHVEDIATAGVLLALAVGVYLYLQPGLGTMQGPVIAYILGICFMVNRAVSTFFGEAFTATQAWLLAVGAALFFLSDLVLAINRFRRELRREPMGLLLYYGGQALIALAPAYFG